MKRKDKKKDKVEVPEKEKQEKINGNSLKNHKGWRIIKIILGVLGILILIVLFVALGIFLIIKNNNKPLHTDWGNRYYEYLINDNNVKDWAKVKIEFLNIDNLDVPILKLNYMKDEKYCTNIYYTYNDDVKVIDSCDYDIVLLYNISEEKAFYYDQFEDDGITSYIRMDDFVNLDVKKQRNLESIKKLGYSFSSDDDYVTTNTIGAELKLSKFDEEFIEIEEAGFNTEIDLNGRKSELKKNFNKAIDLILPSDSLINGVSSKIIDYSLGDLDEQKNEIKTALNDVENQKMEEVTNKYKDYIGTYKNNNGDILKIYGISNGNLYLEYNDSKILLNVDDYTTSDNITIIRNIYKIINNAYIAYIYLPNVTFNIVTDKESDTALTTDVSKTRIYIEGKDMSTDQALYYKE